jgi:hypothetical protein
LSGLVRQLRWAIADVLTVLLAVGMLQLMAKGTLTNKVSSVFTPTATQHGDQ